MTDKQAAAPGKLLFATGFAAVLQIIVMILLATESISSGVAFPLMAIVVIFGIIPAMGFIKSKT